MFIYLWGGGIGKSMVGMGFQIARSGHGMEGMLAPPGKWAFMYGLDISIAGKPWAPMIHSSYL